MKKKDYFTPKVIHLIIEPFKTDFIVYINKTSKEMLADLKKKVTKQTYHEFIEKYNFSSFDEDTTKGSMFQIKGGFIINIKAEKNKFRDFVGIIAHEITHTCHYLLRDRRIPLTEDTEEIYAYLVEDLVKKILRQSY